MVSAVVEIAIARLVRDESVVILRGGALIHCSAAAEAAHEVIYSCCHNFVLRLLVSSSCLFKVDQLSSLLRGRVIHLARLCVQPRSPDFVWWIGRRVGENGQVLTRKLASHLTKNCA